MIDGRYPCLNDYLKYERISFRKNGKLFTKGNELKQKCQNTIIPQIAECLNGAKVTPPVQLHYTFYEPNKNRDKDNVASFFMKVFQDSLTKVKVLENDGWKFVDGFICDFEVDKDNPRIEVEIIEV